MCQTTSAQISFRVNIASQPIWGPVGYDHVDYYYLPEIEAYYNVPTRRYTYMENGRWVTRAYLPQRNRGFDLYNARKVVINERNPYLRHRDYKVRYATSNERIRPQSIRDSRDGKYFENVNHPQHSKWNEYKRNHRRQ